MKWFLFTAGTVYILSQILNIFRFSPTQCLCCCSEYWKHCLNSVLNCYHLFSRISFIVNSKPSKLNQLYNFGNLFPIWLNFVFLFLKNSSVFLLTSCFFFWIRACPVFLGWFYSIMTNFCPSGIWNFSSSCTVFVGFLPHDDYFIFI